MAAPRSIADQIRADIASGKLQPGDQLPPVGNRRPVRRAYRTLITEQLLVHYHGNGTYVAGGPPGPSGADDRVENAIKQLRTDITSGTLPPGAHIPMHTQARRINASLRTVRAAYRTLLAAGLITLKSGNRVHVAGGPAQPARASPQVDRAVAWIRDQISSGACKADTPLPPQRQIAAAAGVGPSSVYAAYRRLKAEGVLRALPGRGMYPSKED